MIAPSVIGVSFYGCCVFLCFFLMWYIELFNTCYVVSPLFFLPCNNHIATNLTFVLEISPNLQSFKGFPSNSRRKLPEKKGTQCTKPGKNGVPTLQILIFLVTRVDNHLRPSTELNKQFSQLPPRMIFYHTAKKHSAPNPDVTSKFKLFYRDSPGVYASRQHKNNQKGFPYKTRNVDRDDIFNEVIDRTLEKELSWCQQFLVDSELERARHKVFNYAMKNLNATIVDGKLDWVNSAFGLISKGKGDGGFKSFYKDENNTLLDRSKLLFTKDDSAKLIGILNKTDVIQSCSGRWMNT